MHVWDGAPSKAIRHNDEPETSSVAEVEVSPEREASSALPDWRGLVAIAAIAIVGWPVVTSGSIHAIWAEVCRVLSFRGKS